MGNAHPNTTEASADRDALEQALTTLNNATYAAWKLARQSKHPMADRIGSVAHATDSIKDAF